MNPFINISQGLQNLLKGTDRYTRMLPVGHLTFWQNLMIGKNEVYETVDNNEMHLFLTTPEVYIPLMKKATMFSNGVFVVKDYRTGDVIENHPLYKVLEQPNPLMNRNEWLIDIAIRFHLFGGSYIYVNKPLAISELPRTLMNIPNEDLIIKTTGKRWEATEIADIIEGYALKNSTQTFKAEDVIQFKNFSKDGVKGVSVLQSLNMPISNARSSYGFVNTNNTKKGALGIISSEATDTIGSRAFTEEERQDLEKQFAEETHGIFDGQSSLRFSNAAMKYTPIAYPIKDQLVFENINHAARCVIDAIGLNDNIFSREKGATFSNFRDGMRSAYQDCIIPFSENFCFALNAGLGLFDQNVYVEMDYSSLPILQEDGTEKATQLKMRAEAIDRLVQIGYSTQEAEQLLGITRD